MFCTRACIEKKRCAAPANDDGSPKRVAARIAKREQRARMYAGKSQPVGRPPKAGRPLKATGGARAAAAAASTSTPQSKAVGAGPSGQGPVRRSPRVSSACIICLDAGLDDGTIPAFPQQLPCCSKLVHRSCLLRWRQQSDSLRSSHKRLATQRECPHCRSSLRPNRLKEAVDRSGAAPESSSEDALALPPRRLSFRSQGR